MGHPRPGRTLAAAVLSLALVGAAPAAVVVDAVDNCYDLDFGQKAASMSLDPGLFTVAVGGEGVRWGTSEPVRRLRTRHVLVDLDPADCSVDIGGALQPVASLCYSDASRGHFTFLPRFRVHRATTIRLYLVDSVVEGNAGSVRVEVQRVEEREQMSARTVGTRVLSPVANCYRLDFSRARSVTLEPGNYRVEVLAGGIRYGDPARYDRRRCANVLIDANPADVRQVDRDPEVGELLPVAALGLAAVGDRATIRVARRTRLRCYLTDSRVAGNLGSVTVSFQPVRTLYGD